MIFVDRYVTFILTADGKWNIQLWADGAIPLTGKVYKVRIPVPAELIGPVIEASVEPL
jgi:hypothetical protein